jgi:hypothetical protein
MATKTRERGLNLMSLHRHAIRMIVSELSEHRVEHNLGPKEFSP